MPFSFVLDSGFSGERSILSVRRYIKILKKRQLRHLPGNSNGNYWAVAIILRLVPSFSPYPKIFIFRMLCNNADAHNSSLGYLWFAKLFKVVSLTNSEDGVLIIITKYQVL